MRQVVNQDGREHKGTHFSHRTNGDIIEQISLYRTNFNRKNAPSSMPPGYIQLEGKSVSAKKCGIPDSTRLYPTGGQVCHAEKCGTAESDSASREPRAPEQSCFTSPNTPPSSHLDPVYTTMSTAGAYFLHGRKNVATGTYFVTEHILWSIFGGFGGFWTRYIFHIPGY